MTHKKVLTQLKRTGLVSEYTNLASLISLM